MRVLLAEPTRIGRTIVSGMLAQEGYTLIPVDSAEAALEALQSDEEIDVLITAIEFATMSGLELCWEARLHADSGRPLYVIVLSSSREEAKLVEALDSGADDFINKPPNRNELLARLRSASRLIQAQRQLIRFANFDALTGLRNRRSFFEEVDRIRDVDTVRTVVMLDIDYFKQVNDRYGHDAGDDVLREVGARLVRADRGFARLGGEEFAVLIAGDAAWGGDLAELVRNVIASTPVETCAGPLAITVSIGVAERWPGTEFDQAMKNADIALYASKSAGRNRVTVSASSGGAQIREIRHNLVA